MKTEQTQGKNLPSTEAGQQHTLTGTTNDRLFDQEQRDRRLNAEAQQHQAPTSYGFGAQDVKMPDTGEGVDPQLYSNDGAQLGTW